MITTYTLTDLTDAVVAFFRVQFPSRDLGTESWLGLQAAAIALTLYQLQAAVVDADRDAIPSTDTSTTRLDEFAILFGLSNGTGGLGRIGAQIATGGVGPIIYSGAGPFPYTLAAGASFVASDGATLLATSVLTTWPSAGSQTGNFNAVTAGAAGNLTAGSVISFVSPPAGFVNTVTLATGLSGGADQESDSALLARILSRLQDPPKAVTAHDLRVFSETAPDAGVVRAYVYPRRSGTGTADIVITQAGSGQARGLATVSPVQVVINTNRIVTAEALTVYDPYMPGANGMTIVARILPSQTTYGFDWDSSAGNWTVSAYNAVTPSLTLSVAAPADFQTAVTNGAKPRLQVNPTGATTPIPEQIQVVAYAAGVCTLAAPFVHAPSNGDVVVSGGYAVPAIAASIQSYVDSLGPSRQSGLYDPLDDAWDDTCRVDQIRRVVLDTTDTDGVTRMVLSMPAAPVINNASGDHQAVDNSPNPPEMLFVIAISVRP